MKKFRFRFTKTAQALLLAILFIPYFSSCGKEEEEKKSNLTEMGNFSILAGGVNFSAELQSDGKTFKFMPPFLVSGQLFDPTSLKNAKVTFVLSPGATCVPASGTSGINLHDGSVKFTVTAEDGKTQKDYFTEWQPGTSDAKQITGFKVQTEGGEYTATINQDNRTITIPFIPEVPMSGELTPDFSISMGAICSPQKNVPQVFKTPVTYSVTAHDQSIQTYTVSRTTSNAAEISTLKITLDNAAGDVFVGVKDAQKAEITITVPYSLKNDLAGAVVEYTISDGATADVDFEFEHDFASAKFVNVTAHDENTKIKWTIQVALEAPSTQAEIVHFYLDFYENPQSTYEWRGEVRMQDNNAGVDVSGVQERMHGAIYIDHENGIITWDMPAVPAWFTTAHMTVFPSVIQISEYATVSPAWNVPQDFSKDVVYTVTAEDGTTKKVWTVKAPTTPYYLKEKWTKPFSNYAAASTGPNSIALIGDYLALSRSTLLINKSDGTLANNQLNVTGIVDFNPGGQATPFFIANDDAGNMIGSNLHNSAWSLVNFALFKWTNDPTDAPELLMNFPTTGEEGLIGGFGRKVQIYGDVNDKALIISPNWDGTTNAEIALRGEHYLWQVEGGVADITNPTVVETGISWGSNAYQLLTPLGLEPVGPYYVGSYPHASGTGVNQNNNLQFGQIGSMEFIKGNLLYQSGGTNNGWGNFSWFYQRVFSFDGKNFIATYSAGWAYDYFTVLERKADGTHEMVISAMLPVVSADNGNRTGSFTMETVGGDIIFYLFQTNYLIRCYKLTKF